MSNFDLHEQATTLADEQKYYIGYHVFKEALMQIRNSKHADDSIKDIANSALESQSSERLEQEKQTIINLINSDNLSDNVDDYFFKKWVLSIWGD